MIYSVPKFSLAAKMYSQHTSKCRCPMNIETGALIFAIFNGLINNVASLLSVMALMAVSLEEVGKTATKSYQEDQILAIGGCVMIVTLVFISCAFSWILMSGLLKKNSEYVKIYFVYGVVVTALLVATTISLSITTVLLRRYMPEDIIMTIKLVLLGITFFYFFILLMIWSTFRKFERKAKFIKDIEQKLLAEDKE